MKTFDLDGRTWTEPETPEEARRPDILQAIEWAVEWQDSEPRVDWERVWDRAEGTTLQDGTLLALPSGDVDGPVYRALKAHGRKHRNSLT